MKHFKYILSIIYISSSIGALATSTISNQFSSSFIQSDYKALSISSCALSKL